VHLHLTFCVLVFIFVLVGVIVYTVVCRRVDVKLVVGQLHTGNYRGER